MQATYVQGYGISGKLLNWIQEFLSHRQQTVMVDGCASDWCEVKSGVPQGSLLQARMQNLMWVGSFQEKVDLFDGAGVQSTPSMQSMLKLGGLGACPPRKIDTKKLDLVTF